MTKSTTHTAVRIPDDLLAAVTAWRERQPVVPNFTATFLEALRRLISEPDCPYEVGDIEEPYTTDRCDARHPGRPGVRCHLSSGHSGDHWYHGLEWAKK